MKRKCAGCRAILCARPYATKCELGYEIEHHNIGKLFVSFTPKEDCPKPTTFKSYYEEKKKRGLY